MNKLDRIKQQKWFYEFTLPDGTKTESYLPEIARPVHSTREKALRHYLSTWGGERITALDISCHEGFFSLVLREYFDRVVGIDKNAESLDKAKQIANLLGHPEINFNNSSLEDWTEDQNADFVLCFGLLYHVENPIQILRKLALLAKKAVCIETQVLPFNLSGPIEDGSYLWQRELNGLFGLCVDYSDRAEGGLTDLALIPSRQCLEFLLKQFGFKTVNFYTPESNDYEQFVRGHRVIVFAEK
ncbi:MAG: class I SAM-dependent methyltransferase [Methylobacter sp.]